jgi:hypothetical protein
MALLSQGSLFVSDLGETPPNSHVERTDTALLFGAAAHL